MQLGPRQAPEQQLPVAHHLGGDLGEIGGGEMRGQRLDRSGGRAVGHLVDDLGLEQRGGAVLHLLELRRNPGLERKPSQDGGAERVDGLDLEPARRFDGAGKQRAGAAQRILGNMPLDPQIVQRVMQRRVVLHRPVTQALEQPVLHLAGGGLGVGQAEDVFGQHALQQQSRHPVGEHPGLARAGIGGQPGGTVGVRRLDLALGGLVALGHGTGLASGRSVSSHSPKRASWS